MHFTLHCSSQMTTSESHTPAEKGFKAVTFDMRGVGRSTGKASLTGFVEIKDVIAGCKLVSKNLSANRILLVGSSAGMLLRKCSWYSTRKHSKRKTQQSLHTHCAHDKNRFYRQLGLFSLKKKIEDAVL
ncbi:putative alpha/Beta hydrolase [Rosa chinensis]|uniref:Putative alpha/Beta hydrolase n=1 Tax=Rosa chinensis TaxID=74649 RepID=A0A2P6SE89_ROSCH|nr:putative alpha/Beta hydrolase [Rosa chinensis]